jgi:hypothetical protein
MGGNVQRFLSKVEANTSKVGFIGKLIEIE